MKKNPTVYTVGFFCVHFLVICFIKMANIKIMYAAAENARM